MSAKPSKRPREDEGETTAEKQPKVEKNGSDKEQEEAGAPLWGNFTKQQRVKFLSILNKFGMSDPKWSKVEAALPSKSRDEILAYVAVFMLHLTDASLGVFNHLMGGLDEEGVPQSADEVKAVLERVALIHLIHHKVRNLEEHWDEQQGWFKKVKRNEVFKLGFRKRGRVTTPTQWLPELDRTLLQGTCRQGFAQNAEISAGLTPQDLARFASEGEQQEGGVAWGTLTEEEREAVVELVGARIMDLAELSLRITACITPMAWKGCWTRDQELQACGPVV